MSQTDGMAWDRDWNLGVVNLWVMKDTGLDKIYQDIEMKAQRGLWPMEGGLPAEMLKDQVPEEKSAKEMDKKGELRGSTDYLKSQAGKPYEGGVKCYQTNAADRAKELGLRTYQQTKQCGASW